MITAHASSRPIVIEFVGAPGAGKSTLLPIVRDACRRHGLRPTTAVEVARPLALRTPVGRLLASLPDGPLRARAAWLLFRWVSAGASIGHVARTWPLTGHVLRSQSRRPPAAETRTRRVTYWFLRLLGVHGLFLRRGAPGEVLLLDEGYVHRVVQLFTSTVEDPDPAALRRYLTLVPVPDLLIAVHAPVERCIERVVDRGVWSRFEGRDPDELRRFIVHAHRAVGIATEHARGGGWPLLEVDNDADGTGVVDGVGASASALRAALADRLRERVGAGG